MACGYLGCGTRTNKIAWGVFGLLLLLGAVLLGVGLGRTVPCSRQLLNCIRGNPAYERDPNICTVPYRQCARSYIIIAGIGAIAVLVALSVVCCMCCCSKPPGPKINQPATGQPFGNMTGVQMTQQSPYPVMGGQATGPPQQGQYGHSPYGSGAYNANSSGPYGYQQQQQPGAFGAPAAGPYTQGPPQYTV